MKRKQHRPGPECTGRLWLHAFHKNYELLMNTRNSLFDRVTCRKPSGPRPPLQYVEFTLATPQDTRLLVLMDSRYTQYGSLPVCHSISQQWAVLSVCGPERFPTLTFLQIQANSLHVYCNMWFCCHCAESNRACQCCILTVTIFIL